MPIFENVRLALTSLRANKLRALLTMLGIIIGISAVIAIITVGDSLSGSLAQEMSSFGARDVTLSVVQKDDPFASGSFDTLGDSEELDKLLESFEYKEPSASDRISDAMLQEYQKKFADQLQAVAVSENFGNIRVVSGRYKARSADGRIPRPTDFGQDEAAGRPVHHRRGQHFPSGGGGGQRPVCLPVLRQ